MKSPSGIGEFLLIVGLLYGLSTGGIARPLKRTREKIDTLKSQKRIGKIDSRDKCWLAQYTFHDFSFFVTWLLIVVGAVFYCIEKLTGG